jgi:competence protein ComEA
MLNFRQLLAAAALALAAATAFAAPADVNRATEAELDAIKGIGPGTTKAILDERKKAPFKDWDDLIARVKGIADKRAEKLSEAGLTVNGKPWNGPKK